MVSTDFGSVENLEVGVIPKWVDPEKIENFTDLIFEWIVDFDERWDYEPTPEKEKTRRSKMLVEGEIIVDFRVLKQDWDIKERSIRSLMVEIHNFLPEKYRISCFNNWKEVHSSYFKNLLEYIEARHADRWLKTQRTETQAGLKTKKTVTKAYKKIKAEDYKRFALIFWLAIKLTKQPIPISEPIVRRLAKDHAGTMPVIWKERRKLMSRRLSENGKGSQFGLIEHFLKEDAGRKSLQTVEPQVAFEVSDQEKLFIGLASTFTIEQIVSHFKRSKTKLGNKFSADRWLADYMQSRDTPS